MTASTIRNSSTKDTMRLLSTETGHFVEIYDPSKVEYAILSHTWDPVGEQSYREIRELQKSLNMPILPESAISDMFDLSTRQPSPAPFYNTFPQYLHPPFPPSPGTSTFVFTHLATSSPPAVVSLLDHPGVSSKVRRACALARRYGHRLIWIDSCCIDKESSSELSEAINSMFRWYRDASVCYAFLSDVPMSDLESGVEGTGTPYWDPTRPRFSLFRQSRWFTRGWTLQELVAPRVVIFVSQEWVLYGSKGALASVISEVTCIDVEVLTYRKRLQDVAVFHRMSWASNRTTTRIEDLAYSLLGIFDIHMPIIYGEGPKAFTRLQQAILQGIPDESLFIWNASGLQGSESLLRLPSSCFRDPMHVTRKAQARFAFQPTHTTPAEAASLFAHRPSDFSSSFQRIAALSHLQLAHRLGIRDISLPTYSVTPYGINARFPLIPLNQVILPSSTIGSLEGYHLAFLACEDTSEPGSLIAMICLLENFPSSHRLMKKSSICFRSAELKESVTRHTEVRYIVLSRDQVNRLDHTHVRITSVHIPIGTEPALSSTPTCTPQETDDLLPPISPWNLEILKEAGFSVTCFCDCATHNLSLVRLLHRSGGIQLRFEVTAAFIPFVDVWITPFYWHSPGSNGLVPDASPAPTFRFQVRDVHQERSTQVFLPSASGGEPITIRLSLYYLISFHSCALTLEALRTIPLPVSNDASPRMIQTLVSPPTSGSDQGPHRYVDGGGKRKLRSYDELVLEDTSTDIVCTFKLLKRRRIL